MTISFRPRTPLLGFLALYGTYKLISLILSLSLRPHLDGWVYVGIDVAVLVGLALLFHRAERNADRIAREERAARRARQHAGGRVPIEGEVR